MIKFALLGAGRIGKMHANNIVLNSQSDLEVVYDVNNSAAREVSNMHNCKIAQSAEEAITNKNIDAIWIASSTPTHIQYILLAAKAGKAIFCEKPIDLDINKVDQCKKDLENFNVPIHIGFNRRFDLSHSSLKKAKDNGEIGNLEMIVISSRDPASPGIEYLREAGGFFRDTAVHDFDLTRFILGDDPIIEISAYANVLFSKAAKETNDLDTAMFILKSQSGVLCHINNSRRAVYGYDQRVEIFGSKGMIISDNQSPTSVKKFDKNITNSEDPIYYFFIERYDQAYKNQLNIFIDCIKNKKATLVNFEDGRNALIIANAAYESLKTKKSVKIKY